MRPAVLGSASCLSFLQCRSRSATQTSAMSRVTPVCLTAGGHSGRLYLSAGCNRSDDRLSRLMACLHRANSRQPRLVIHRAYNLSSEYKSRDFPLGK